MHYLDTRQLDASRPTFTRAVLRGIAEGGGLYVPESLPRISLEEILAFEDQPYDARATYVFGLFGVDIEGPRVAQLMGQAYGDAFDDRRVAPVEKVSADTHVLELWHGPTSAFKDMALQCMPVFFSEAIEDVRAGGGPAEDYLVLVATSGDTGKAALDGFAGRPHTRIAVFYPPDGVSDLQRLQRVTQRGENVTVFGVRGDFDDCQNAVKAAFDDDAFAEELRERHGLRLSSANSINWGRLLPQIVYYVSAYADMVASGGVKPGAAMDVCVPTGNFGNILGAYYARAIGTPIGRLLCASNETNVLSDFIATGVYDVSERRLVTTPSPSMDILISSNLERLLFELTRDGGRVRGWIDELSELGRFQVDMDTFQRVREVFLGDWVTNDDSLATIRRVWEQCAYLLDPHTAVAWEVAERLRADAPVLVVSTAHWAKFGGDVYRALTGAPADAELPADVAELGPIELLGRVSDMTGGQRVPRTLAGLDGVPARFTEIVDGTVEGVEAAVALWLE